LILLFIYLYQWILYFHMYSWWWLSSFHFVLKNSLIHFLLGNFIGNEFLQFLCNWTVLWKTIFPSLLKYFSEYSMLDWKIFLFPCYTLSIIYHPILSRFTRFLLRNSLIVLWGFSYIWLDRFCLLLLILSLSFWLLMYWLSGALQTTYLGWIHLESFDFWTSWIWMFISVPRFGNFSAIVALNMPSTAFSVSFLIPVIQIFI
jgi:hypothetical protein